MAILRNLNEMSKEDLIAALIAAKAQNGRALRCKVTAPKLDPKTGEMKGSSGAVSVYGLGQFPVTLYASQWDRLFTAASEINAFMEANRALLSTKG